MATVTLRECVSEIRQAYEGCNDAIALGLAREALRYLCDEFSVAVVNADVALVAGISRYAVPDSWAGLRSVALLETGPYEDDGIVELLQEDDVDDADELSTLYRFERPGTPRKAMMDGGYLVLVPAPDVSTPVDGMGVPTGYPRLSVEATLSVSQSPNVPLPTSIRTTDPIVNRACRRWAKLKDKPALQMWMELEEAAVNEFERSARRRNRRHKSQSWPESYHDEAM